MLRFDFQIFSRLTVCILKLYNMKLYYYYIQHCMYKQVIQILYIPTTHVQMFHIKVLYIHFHLEILFV